MSAQLKKTLLIGLGIFAALILTVGIVYFVRKPATTTVTPPPTPKAAVAPTNLESPVAAPIFVVEQISACKKTFTVACASLPPVLSPSPSASSIASSTPSTPPAASLDCVAKRMYEDDSRNRTGFYYLEREITDANTLTDGQTILYNITTKNSGGNGAPDTTITDVLSSNLTFVDGDSGCTYDATTRTVTCIIGTLSPNSEAQRSFRAKVAVTGSASVANTAEVTSTNGQRDSCSVKIDATGKVVTVATPAPTALPVAGVFEITAGTIGVGFLFLLAGALGLLLI